MKIIINSEKFYPSVGGAETNAEILAREFVAFGHDVKLITQNNRDDIKLDQKEFIFEVIRKPNWLQLSKQFVWCDVYFQNGISLKHIWLIFLTRKPWIVRQNIWISYPKGTLAKINYQNISYKEHFKYFLIRFAKVISISQAIADHLHSPSIVIGNPYRDQLFKLIPDQPRTKELVFLGRLVSVKGVDILLKTLKSLKERGLIPQLTIIGSGSEEDQLKQQVKDFELTSQVTFVGTTVGDELVRILNQHQIIVVPTLEPEPFGVVALEGIACGCVVVGSEGGGLKDAIGNCGMTFPNGDVEKLTECLFDLLTHPEKLTYYRQNAPSHLARHTSKAVAKAYLKVIEEAIK